jgi:hypothetical protein
MNAALHCMQTYILSNFSENIASNPIPKRRFMDQSLRFVVQLLTSGESTPIIAAETERLPTELEMLKVVLYLVTRPSFTNSVF